jgi:endonuclease YncB( thermonuclease family)
MDRRCSILLTAFVASLLGAFPALASEFQVVDGDTIKSGDDTYRLEGIDAPESSQQCALPRDQRWMCGTAATARMVELVAGRNVTCETHGKDEYGRDLATCRGGGVNINEVMVREGLAWAFRKYSSAYEAVENEARAAHRGVWQADSETPWDFRARRWQVAKQDAPKGCPIKGNINSKGERIYHAPWSRDYDRTRVDAAKGERWFCSEAEAIAAGWRAPMWGR